jgi:hypothetical protein
MDAPAQAAEGAQTFPGISALYGYNLRRRLIDFIQRHKASGAAGGAYYESALRELGEPP